MTEKKTNKKVEETIASLNKTYGSGAVMKFGDAPEKAEYDIIPTGSLKLDIKSGIGGYPRGRIIEIKGWESSGKTTLLIHAIAECQKKGLLAAIIDVEHAFDIGYARALGVDVDNLYISQPMSAEEGLEILDTLIKTEEFGLIGIDSVAALVPQKELEGEMGQSSIGLQSRLMGQALRKITALAERHKTLVIFINQLREKIGVMFGSPETTSGGNALRFYASMRLDVRRTIDKENEKNLTRVTFEKNKLAPPFGKAEIDIVWGKGIDRNKEIVDLGVEYDIIHKGGAWYTYKEMKFQGLDKLQEAFNDNPEVYAEVEEAIKTYLKNAEEVSTVS